ncbi:hypothetical protein T492DRAFT_1064554, partial [Pavlovales sp. CCMP2436]
MAPASNLASCCLLALLLPWDAHALVGRAPASAAIGRSSRTHTRIGPLAMRLDETEPAPENPAERAPESLARYLLPYAGGVVVAFLLASAAFYVLVTS